MIAALLVMAAFIVVMPGTVVAGTSTAGKSTTAKAAGKTTAAKPTAAKTAQRPIRVVIDPGHGGNNMGAIGPYGVHEKYVTLQIAMKLGELLKASENVVVFYTRVADVAVSLPDRAEMANALDADLFLSIHCNAAENTEANGIETFYLGAGSDTSTKELAKRENGRDGPLSAADPDQSLDVLLADMAFNGNQNESSLLASEIQRSLTKAFADVRNREVRQAPFTVLEHANMPAVVIETGFITHVSEGRKLLMADHQQKLATTIQKAVISFVKNAEERPAFARQYEVE
jgi:N-acetylmuramoyl-L-alanine amidase